MEFLFDIDEPVHYSWTTALIKKNFPDVTFIDDHYGQRCLINQGCHPKTLVRLNEEKFVNPGLSVTADKRSFMDYVSQFGKDVVIMCNVGFLRQWLDQEGIPNLYCNVLDEAITLAKLTGLVNFQAPDSDTRYICLNNRQTTERMFLLHTLDWFDLIKHGYVTDNSKNPIRRYPGVRYNTFSYPYILPEAITKSYQGVLCSQNFLNMLQINELPGRIMLQVDTISYDFYPSEKSTQAFILKRIPLILGSKGHMRRIKHEWGLDIFDDVVDYSHEDIDNPLNRIKAAIKNNQHLLSHPMQHDYQERLNKNFDFVVQAWPSEFAKLCKDISTALSQ